MDHATSLCKDEYLDRQLDLFISDLIDDPIVPLSSCKPKPGGNTFQSKQSEEWQMC